MARVRDMRNIKKVEDEQTQNTGSHPHDMADGDASTSLDSYIENDKKVEENTDNKEVVNIDEFDYKKIGEIIAADLYELHKRFGASEVDAHDFPTIIELKNKDVNDFTKDNDDYIRFLESKVTRLEYEIAKLKGAK